ncbi:ImmA/IrrE family metallo-endopeptidase [Allorhizocola rhizosphaerae]|uniref:ImmA/IrrE family metallo-endopeptidase n=1 Tax=Allorhizocola rhizosphaerae TaxID=1872709 RepID=UPI001FE9AE66|nr:ImmA/IrrE family metallo-endopeptidase [Allorhizocola rhizosphaerae]
MEDEATQAGRESFRLEASLMSWLRDVRQIQALGMLGTPEILRYPGTVDSGSAAREAANWLRQRLGHGREPISSLMATCEQAGLFLAVLDLPGDGASVIDGDVAAAVVGRFGDPGRRRATAAHELGHIVLGDEYSSDLGVSASRADRESVIDAFAAELLLPTDVISARGSGLTRDALVRLTALYRTSWSLAVRQAVQAAVLDEPEATGWLAQTPTRAELLDAVGWAPQPDLDWIRVPPSFAHAVLDARRRQLISTARAVELMRGQIEEKDLPAIDGEEAEP